MKEEIYKVTEADLIGDIKGFPIEVVRMMILRQVEQGNLPDVRKFQRESTVAVHGGGFTWNDAVDGYEFWERVISEKQWHVFFNRYPHGSETGIKKAKPLKASRKMHFTKAQKWCLERIRLNTGTIHTRLKAILGCNLRSTPHFDFPILTGEIDEALKLFCLEGYDSASLESKSSALRVRITETLTSIYYMNQALMYDDARGTACIWGEELTGVRSALNWAKKHYALLDKLNHIRFGNVRFYTTINVASKVSVIPPCYKYDKEIGAYTTERQDIYMLGNILIHINQTHIL